MGKAEIFLPEKCATKLSIILSIYFCEHDLHHFQQFTHVFANLPILVIIEKFVFHFKDVRNSESF